MSPSRIGIHSNKALIVVLAAFTISLLANIGTLVYVVVDSQGERARICQAQNEVRFTIQEQIRAGAEEIPELAYYKEHPDELKRALEQNQEAVMRFAPIECEKEPSVGI